jgi:hypothetical protein
MKQLLAMCVALSMVLSPSMVVVAADDSKLERVESKVESDSDTSQSSSSVASSSTSVAGSVAGGFIEALLNVLFAGLFYSTGFDSGMNAGEFHTHLRQTHHPALPTFRLFGAYHKPFEDLQAYNLNVVAGYLMIAGEFDLVHYFENSPSTQLKIMSPRLAFRFAPSRVLEMDVTVGAKIIRGRQTSSGFEFGVPIYFFLGRQVILDVQSYYSVIKGTKIYDFSGGAAWKYKLLTARAGYRAIDIGGETLHGPTFGVGMQW